MLTTANLGLKKPQTTDAPSALRTAISDNADTLDAKLGKRGKSIVSATETRSSTSYGLLTTPDRVQSVVLPTDGLIVLLYQATWQESVVGAASAAIFIGANQLKALDATNQSGTWNPTVASAAIGSSVGNVDRPLMTWGVGLIGPAIVANNTPYGGDVTTGQAVGQLTNTGAGSPFTLAGIGGPCYIFAAAGTYDVSVQFKASSGTVTAKNRKLWVWTEVF